MNQSLKIPIAIAVAGIIVAGAIYFVKSGQELSTASSKTHPELMTPVGPQDHILGSPDAPVKIVEYADFDCEYCKAFDQTMQQIIANDGPSGKVAWVYREFPLTEIHPQAMQAAQAAECVATAAGNGAFWSYAQELFANQPADPSQFGVLAQRAGVHSNAFATCMENASSTVGSTIAAERKNALAMGARGTPFSLLVVNGQPVKVLDGAYSYTALQALISKALNSIGTSTPSGQ